MPVQSATRWRRCAIDKMGRLVKDFGVFERWGVTDMTYRAVIIILALALSYAAVAAEEKSEQSPGTQQQPYIPSLAVVMQLIQLSHFKLWLAGNLRNWPLAEYELLQMRATLQDAKTLFPNVRNADTSTILQSAEEFQNAIKTKDGTRFDRAFEKFTSACNSCHKAAGLEFIDIRVPRLSPIMTSPLSDQSFAPK